MALGPSLHGSSLSNPTTTGPEEVGSSGSDRQVPSVLEGRFQRPWAPTSLRWHGFPFPIVRCVSSSALKCPQHGAMGTPDRARRINRKHRQSERRSFAVTT